MKDRFNQLARRLPTWVVYIAGALYPAWLLWKGLTGGLGVDPVKVMEHSLGLAGLQLLMACLCISPLRRFLGVNLLRFRRVLGLLSFAYIALHLLVWLVLDVQILSQIVADIAKRPYITIGMAGFALMIPLAITSNGWSVRWLGRRWQKLHQLTYVVAVLGPVHFFMLVKGFQIEPVVYLVLAGTLLAMRFIPRRRPAPAKH